MKKMNMKSRLLVVVTVILSAISITCFVLASSINKKKTIEQNVVNNEVVNNEIVEESNSILPSELSDNGISESDYIDEALRILDEYKFTEDEEIKYLDSYKDMLGAVIYEFDSDKAIYTINSTTDEVTSIIRKDVAASGFLISMDEAQGIAVAAINRYRPDFDMEKSVLSEAAKNESTGSYMYQFEWRTVVDGVDLGSVMTVNISGEGDFVMYSCIQNKNADFDPGSIKVGKDEAEKIASDWFKERNNSPYYIDYAEIHRTRDGKTVWDVTIAYGDLYYITVEINAEDGSIICWIV